MLLSINELSQCLSMPADTLRRWIRQGRIPVKLKGDKCIFKTRVLTSWANEHHLTFLPPDNAKKDSGDLRSESMVEAMKTGGVYYDVPGKTVPEVLAGAVECISDIIGNSVKPILLKSLLDREKMMSTGIGHGIAVPHPRKPLAGTGAPPLIATCFLKNPVDYDAIDHLPVFILFLLVAPDSRTHLDLLARIAYCIRDQGFRNLLADTPEKDVLFEKAAEFEAVFDKTHP